MLAFLIQAGQGVLTTDTGAGLNIGWLAGGAAGALATVGSAIAWILTHIAGKEKECREERKILQDERAGLYKQLNEIAAENRVALAALGKQFTDAIRDDRREHRIILGRILGQKLHEQKAEGG